jgi:hypothetical protein
MMDIDATITKYKENAEFYKGTTNIRYGLELEQIVEWLEELKEMWNNQGAVSDFWYLEGYNKALNDFAEKISVYGTFDYHGNTIDVFEIAEQMKME